MKNTKLKYNANPVGVAVLGDPQKNTKFNADSVGAGLVPAQNEKGITLIALIITIIVMLILVGVTINVALNGGLFSKAKDATSKTKIAQIQEALLIKKAEILADNNGIEPKEYTIGINDLEISEGLKKEYESKLTIQKDGKLYYNPDVVTNETEQNQLKELGVNEGTRLKNSYTFTIGELVDNGAELSDGFLMMLIDDKFWPSDISQELINSKYKVTVDSTVNGDANGEYLTYNITCSDPRYISMFKFIENGGDISEMTDAFYLMAQADSPEMVVFSFAPKEGITRENYSDYKDVAFTISMPL